MVIFWGNERPYDFSAGKQADSVLMSLLHPIKRHEAMSDLIGDMMFEACVDVVKVPGLFQMVQDPEQEAALLKRFGVAKQMKSNNRITLLHTSTTEAERGEEWEQKTISFATLPDVLRADQFELCAAARQPHALLFGQSSGGLGSTGDMELSSYYDSVNTIQTNDIEPAINTLDECILRDALGTRPADIWYQWNSLWQISDKERSEIGSAIADKWQKLVNAGVFPSDAVTDAVINDLTEAGVGGGIEQTYQDWLDEGGMRDDPMEEDDDLDPSIA
jgi:phage-related protein (TIGR01555 family)